jgi:hypothetical protein
VRGDEADLENVFKWVLIAGVAYLIYQTLGKGLVTAGTAVGSAIGGTVADFYTWAVLSRSNMTQQGNITLPDGTLVPLQDTPLATAPNGVVAALINGQVYQLYASDVNGNYPATPW